MFLGLLIGLTLFGAAASWSNKSKATKYVPDRRSEGQRITFLIGNFCFYLGLCGSIGWCIEVFA